MNNFKKNINIDLGALSDTLEKQLTLQGFVDKQLDKHELLKKSICTLFLHGYISCSQSAKMRDKLFKDIIKNLKEDK